MALLNSATTFSPTRLKKNQSNFGHYGIVDKLAQVPPSEKHTILTASQNMLPNQARDFIIEISIPFGNNVSSEKIISREYLIATPLPKFNTYGIYK
jgi:hypothetical protein